MSVGHKYNEKSYWDERFQEEENYEWLCGVTAFKDILERHIDPKHRILHLGCGTSRLSFDLVDIGCHQITNVDFSETLIARCEREHPDMKWVCGDIRALTDHFDTTDRFDVIIEKATIDSMLVDEKDPWCLSDSGVSCIDSILNGVSKLLTSNGKFISITWSQPHFRLPLYALTAYDWSVTVESFNDGMDFFCYVMEKSADLDWTLLDRYLYPIKKAHNGSLNDSTTVTLDEDCEGEFLARFSE